MLSLRQSSQRFCRIIFKRSEADGANFVYLPGWNPLEGETTPLGSNGPGDFASVFDFQSSEHTNHFDGFGTDKHGQRWVPTFPHLNSFQHTDELCAHGS
jgi:hypothetical protein